MNLLADESVDWPVVERLRQEWHNAVYIAEVSPSISDDDVLQHATDLHALLVTADKDFGELVFRQGRLHTGVVLLRLAGLSPSFKAQIVARAFRDRSHKFPGAFSVILPSSVRVRRKP